jgi:HEAT repeat protein
MKRSRILLVVLLIAIPGIVWIALNSRESEPAYQGKSLSSWLAQRNSQTWPAITNMGDKAVPFLARKLEARFDPYSKLHQSLEHKLPLKAMRMLPAPRFRGRSDYFEQRRGAASYLGMLGATAKPAIPALLNALRDPEPEIRFPAARALEGISPGDERLMPTFLGLLNDKAGNVRQAGALGLQKYGPKASAAVPRLIWMLKNDYSLDQWASAQTLGIIGSNAVAAVPALTEALSVTNAYVRVCAARALWRIVHETKATIPVLSEAAGDEEVHTRRYAVSTLREMGPLASNSAPTLVKLLSDQDQTVRAAATNALKVVDSEIAAKAGVN